jgi:hypothetical protein
VLRSALKDEVLPVVTRRFCYDRLSSLLKTLEVTDTLELTPIQVERKCSCAVHVTCGLYV